MDPETIAQLQYLYGNQDDSGMDIASPVNLIGAANDVPQIPQLSWQTQASVQTPKNFSQKIQEWLGAKDPDSGGMAQDILSSRFDNGTSYGDYATGIKQSALGTPTLGTEVGTARMNDQLKQMQSMATIDSLNARADLYRKGGTGTNGATMQIINGLMTANPGMTFDQALYQYQTGNRQGTNLTPTGIQPMAGALSSITAKNAAEAAGILTGKGEISPIAAKATGQSQMATILNEMKTKVADLDKLGGLVNPNNPAGQNISAFAKNTGVGQLVQKAIGTKEQSLRNDIASMEPLVINSIRQSTGMSAKAMDSNTELRFYREAVRAGDVQAQLNAINRIFKMYGPGSNLQIPFEDTQAYEDSLAGSGIVPGAPSAAGGLTPSEQAELNGLRQRFKNGSP